MKPPPQQHNLYQYPYEVVLDHTKVDIMRRWCRKNLTVHTWTYYRDQDGVDRFLFKNQEDWRRFIIQLKDNQ